MTDTTTVRRVIITGDALYPNRRYPLPSEYRNDIMASIDDRWVVLESIDIARDDTVTPLQAWRDETQRLSGESVGVPMLDLGFSPMDVREFAFYLA